MNSPKYISGNAIAIALFLFAATEFSADNGEPARTQGPEASVLALLEEWDSGDRDARQKVVEQLSKREFTEQEVEELINFIKEEKLKEPSKLFTLIVHPNEKVRERALKVLENSTRYPKKLQLTEQNKKDLLNLQKSNNPTIRGYVVLLLFRFQKQIAQWDPERHVANLVDAIRHSYEGYHAPDITYPNDILYPVEVLHAFERYPQKRLALLNKCFSSDDRYSQRLCLHLLKKYNEDIKDISLLLNKIISISKMRGEKDDKDLRRVAFEILFKRASENKKIVLPYLKKILKPSEKFPQDLEELALKTEFMEQAIYLNKEGKMLIPEMTRLYRAIERVSKLTSPPPGYARLPHPTWYPENKKYTQKSIYFVWENTYRVFLPNYFWQAYRKFPVNLIKVNK